MPSHYEPTPLGESAIALAERLMPLAAKMGFAVKAGGGGAGGAGGGVVEESTAPMRLMKNITPGAATDADAARPVTASPGDYVIELLERQVDILQQSLLELIKVENVLHETRVQNMKIAEQEAKERAEARQDAKEASMRGQKVYVIDQPTGLEGPLGDTSPAPVDSEEGKGEGGFWSGVWNVIKGIFLAIGGVILGFTSAIIPPKVLTLWKQFTTRLASASKLLGRFGKLLLRFNKIGLILWGSYELLKRMDWSSFVEPFRNALTLVKDVAESVWGIFGKVVDIIEVSFMPMMRFFGDILYESLIQPVMAVGGEIKNFLQPALDSLGAGIGRVVDWLTIFWQDTIQPMVTSFGEGLDTIKNFFKGIQDLRGAELREAIVGGFGRMIDSLWDAIARSTLGKFLGMDTNEKKREQEFEKRREDAREQHKERVGEQRQHWLTGSDTSTGIMALPENERAAAIAESEKWLEMDLRGIDSDVAAEKFFREHRDAKVDEAVTRGEGISDSTLLNRRGRAAIGRGVEAIGQGVEAVGQAGERAYAGLRIKGSSGQTQIGGGGQATGGGPAHDGLINFASMIQPNVAGFDRFTAFNDNFHQASRTSMHARGLALDFTVDDPNKAPAAAATVRRIAADAGVPSGDVDVIDEYNNPSSNATAGHIHAEFNTESAAMMMAGVGLDPSPTFIPPSLPLFGGGGVRTPAATAQLPRPPAASRSGAGVAAATAGHAQQAAGAPVIVTNIGGPSAPPVTTITQAIPIPINARTEDQVLRVLHSVNHV